jgi:biotin carboxyl carrier protein
MDIKIDQRIAKVELVKSNNNKISIKVDYKLYDIDIVMVESGSYSILHEGKSFNIELIKNSSGKKYSINTLYKSFDVEIIDAETRYLESRNKSKLGDERNTISSPMPGKIVKIPVKVNEMVKSGQPVIIVSAMKMESEYKVGRDCIIKQILVKEGDIIFGHQPLILIE